jgi:hypothetical protein
MATKDKIFDMDKYVGIVKLIDTRVVFQKKHKKLPVIDKQVEVAFKIKRSARNYFRSVSEKICLMALQ